MLDVKVELSKGMVASGATVEQALDQVVPATATALARAVRARVQDRGDLAGQAFPGWDDIVEDDKGVKRGRRKFTSAKYPDKARGKLVPSGAEMFDSSAAYHRANGTQRGTYSTTGGMWSGLSAVVWSRYKADVLFRGRSDGQDPRFVPGPDGGAVSKPLKVSNALKAWTVINKHRVNILALSERELVGIGAGVVQVTAGAIAVEMPVEWGGTLPASGQSVSDTLYRAIVGV